MRDGQARPPTGGGGAVGHGWVCEGGFLKRSERPEAGCLGELAGA